MQDIKKHKRVNDILLGPLERPTLKWLAAHTPSWINPDHLTIIGLIGSLLIFAGYALTRVDPAFLWLASLGFFINWYGDSLDGTLARYRRQERPIYGYFVDHVVDAVSEALVFIGMGLSIYIRFDLALLALVSYMLLSILVFIRTSVKGEFVISYGKIGPTEARVLAILANTLIFFVGNPKISLINVTLSVYDWIIIFVIILIMAFFTISALTQINQLRKEGK